MTYVGAGKMGQETYWTQTATTVTKLYITTLEGKQWIHDVQHSVYKEMIFLYQDNEDANSGI